MDNVIQLYPLPGRELPLEGLYLAHDLRAAAPPDRPFVYSNFVVSVDGRIAIPAVEDGMLTVPEQIANDRDWRLYQELAVQADVHLTSGRYLRDYEAGRAQEILNLYDNPQFSDLAEWRANRGLARYPALAVISASLDFSVPEALTSGDRRLFVFTTEAADAGKRRSLAEHATVITAGATRVEGAQLVSRLYDAGYRLIYNATGPKVLYTLLAAGRLDRLYLTYANRLLGGNSYSTVVDGDLLDPAPGTRIHSIYLDPRGLDGLGQLFVSYAIL